MIVDLDSGYVSVTVACHAIEHTEQVLLLLLQPIEIVATSATRNARATDLPGVSEISMLVHYSTAVNHRFLMLCCKIIDHRS